MAERALAAVVLTASAVAVGIPIVQARGPDAAKPASEHRLTLVDQTFSVGPGDELRFELRLDGPLPDEVLPTTTTTTTTTTSTVPRRGGQSEGDERPRSTTTPAASTTTAAPTTTLPPATSTPATVPPPVGAGTITVVVHPRLLDAAAVDAALAGDVGEPDDGVQLPSLADAVSTRSAYDGDDDQVDLTVSLPASSGISEADDLEMSEPGIYPVTIAVQLDDTTVAAHTTLVHRLPEPGDGAQVRLGVMAAAVDDDAARLDAIAALGDGDLPLTVAIDPDLLTSLAEDDPQRVDELAESLRGEESVALPDGELDPSSAATADLASAFGDAWRAGEDVLARHLPETPARRTIWPLVDEPISAAGAQLLSAGGTRALLVSPSLGASLVRADEDLRPGERIRTPLADSGTALSSIAIDPGVAALVEVDDDRSDDLGDSVRLLSTVLVDAGPGERRGVVLAAPDLAPPDRQLLGTLDRLVDEAPDVGFVDVSTLAGYADEDLAAQVTLPSEAGVDLQPRLTRVNLAKVELLDTASMLPDGDPRPDRWNARLDELVSPEVTEAEATSVIAFIEADAASIREAIVPPEPFSFTLTDRTSELQLRLTNDGGTPLEVVVVPASPRLSFPAGPQTVRIDSGATVFVPIEISARANGTTAMVVAVRSPAGRDVVPPIVLTANVRALTGVGQVITGGALLVLATWWVSHLRAGRRQRRASLAAGRHPANASSAGDVSPDAAEATATPPPDPADDPSQ